MQAPQELPLSADLCNNLVSVAQNTADQVLMQEGRSLQLEEEVDLQLPFLLPEDGHSCDIIKGLPSGLLDFLEALQNAGLCWLWQNTQGPGSWKKFMAKEQATVTSGGDSGGTTPLPSSNVQAKQQSVVAEQAQAPNGLLSKIGKGRFFARNISRKTIKFVYYLQFHSRPQATHASSRLAWRLRPPPLRRPRVLSSSSSSSTRRTVALVCPS